VRKPKLDVDFYRRSTGTLDVATTTRLIFRDVHYTIPNRRKRGEELHLLRGVSGRALPGELVALMGASGAGKSTLLDVLAGRKTQGTITGDILYNGKPRSLRVDRNMAYVMQDNVHIGVLTVRETLWFATQLRMDRKIPENKKQARVQKVMDMLGLAEVADTIVGTHKRRGISGGQLKRLTIGVEIIRLPDMIFMDEPTSGLDSSIAFEVMAAVRNLANQSRTIISTIHQPSIQVFDMFDKLLLMAEGRAIYFGPAKDVAPFFTESPYGFHFDPSTNPADFCIDVAGGNVQAANGKYVPGNELVDYFRSTELYQTFEEHVESMMSMDLANAPDESQEEELEPYPNTQQGQVKTLLLRRLFAIRSEPAVVIAGFVRYLILGLFYGSLFFDLGQDNQTDKLGLFFFMLLLSILNHQTAIPAMIEDRLLFYRERGAGALSTRSYWSTIALIQIPFEALYLLLFCALVVPMTNIRSDGEGFMYLYICVFCSTITGLSLCQFVASFVANGQSGLALMPIMIFPFVAFSGFMVRITTMPEWLRAWGPPMSFVKWALEGLCLNELLPSRDDDLATEILLDDLGFRDWDKWDSIPIIILWAVFFRIATFLSLKFIIFENR